MVRGLCSPHGQGRAAPEWPQARCNTRRYGCAGILPRHAGILSRPDRPSQCPARPDDGPQPRSGIAAPACGANGARRVGTGSLRCHIRAMDPRPVSGRRYHCPRTPALGHDRFFQPRRALQQSGHAGRPIACRPLDRLPAMSSWPAIHGRPGREGILVIAGPSGT